MTVKFRAAANAETLAQQAVHLLSDIKTHDNMLQLFKNIEEGLVTDEEYEGGVTGAKIKLTPELSAKLTEVATKAAGLEYTTNILQMLENVGVAKSDVTTACVDAIYDIAKGLPNDNLDLKTAAVLKAVALYQNKPEAVKETVNTAFQEMGTAVYKTKGGLFAIFNKKANPDKLNEALGLLQDAVDAARVQDFNAALNLKGKNAPSV